MEVTKTNKKIGLILVVVLAISAIFGGTIMTTYACEDQGGRPNKAPFFNDRTDEQKEEIKTIVEELKEAGASREEIKDAVDSKLMEWGIEVPEFRNGPKGRHPPFLKDLTEEQREEIKDIVEIMRENGASREEIKAAVDSKLAEWGIEVPESEGPRLPPWMNDLTDDQKEELKTIVEELKEAGATKEEIREAVKEKLEEWNIDLPEKP